MAQLMLANCVLADALLVQEHRVLQAASEAPLSPEIESLMDDPPVLVMDLPGVDDDLFHASKIAAAMEADAAAAGPAAAGSSTFGPQLEVYGPRAPGEAETPRKGLWTRIKDFMAEDWRQTKEDMAAIGRWFSKPIKGFRYAWRRLREKCRNFRKKLFRAGKLTALALVGRRLDEEEEMVHMLLTAYIDQNGVEKLLEVLSKSDNDELEQVALLGRKVEDPVLQSQMVQRYIARKFLRMKKEAQNQDPEVVQAKLARIEEGAAQLETADPQPEDWKPPQGEVPPAPVYTPYYPYKPSKDGKKSLSMKKILIGLIAGAGLVLSGYFAFTTMTMAPFLAFLSTVVSLLAMLRNDFQYGQQIVVMPPQHQGPWPQQPPTEEPPPPTDLDPGTLPGGGGGGDLPPDLEPDPVPAPRPPPPPADDPNPTPGPQEKVSLNTADLDALQELPGVGPVLAQRILAARPFASAQDVLKVKGVGPAKLKAIAPYATLK